MEELDSWAKGPRVLTWTISSALGGARCLSLAVVYSQVSVGLREGVFINLCKTRILDLMT